MNNKIKGALFGVATGDALGVSCEFLEPIQIERMYGRVAEITGGGIFGFDEGEVSDDTQLTISVAKWEKTKPKDIGNIMEKILGTYDGDWFSAAEKAHFPLLGRSAGNGSLMRVIPVALLYNKLEDAVSIAHLQSKMTHYDNLASEACVIYIKIAHRLLQNEFLATAIQKEIKGTRYESILYEKPITNPDGFVVHTLEWVLHVLLETSSFEEAMVTCTNNGYDADTTAAIAGGLAGIYYGYESIPQRYIDKLLIKDELEALAVQISNKTKRTRE